MAVITLWHELAVPIVLVILAANGRPFFVPLGVVHRRWLWGESLVWIARRLRIEGAVVPQVLH